MAPNVSSNNWCMFSAQLCPFYILAVTCCSVIIAPSVSSNWCMFSAQLCPFLPLAVSDMNFSCWQEGLTPGNEVQPHVHAQRPLRCNILVHQFVVKEGPKTGEWLNSLYTPVSWCGVVEAVKNTFSSSKDSRWYKSHNGGESACSPRCLTYSHKKVYRWLWVRFNWTVA
jgi:hypothetical protein